MIIIDNKNDFDKTMKVLDEQGIDYTYKKNKEQVNEIKIIKEKPKKEKIKKEKTPAQIDDIRAKMARLRELKKNKKM